MTLIFEFASFYELIKGSANYQVAFINSLTLVNRGMRCYLHYQTVASVLYLVCVYTVCPSPPPLLMVHWCEGVCNILLHHSSQGYGDGARYQTSAVRGDETTPINRNFLAELSVEDLEVLQNYLSRVSPPESIKDESAFYTTPSAGKCHCCQCKHIWVWVLESALSAEQPFEVYLCCWNGSCQICA